jgi:mRNA interferase MazF
MPQPLRGEVWYVDFDPTRGHEQAGLRPALVVSADSFNRSPAGLAIVIPLTSRNKGIRTHIEVPAGEGGLKKTSFVRCEDVRSVSMQRFGRRLGVVTGATLSRTEAVLRFLLDL